MGIGDWGYCKHNGPATWVSSYPAAGGKRQSPINIVTSEVTSDDSLNSSSLTWRYIPHNTKYVTNSGHGWKVEVDYENSELTGGPLSNKYQLEQFHCHWGKTGDTGSEHTVDGHAFPAEIHLVHWNSEKYGSFAEAAKEADGLAVIGVFLKAGSEHPELLKMTDLLSSITYKDDKIFFTQPFDPAQLIPENHSYWTYPGSLTTPPCFESVTWIVLQEPIEVSEAQLQAFRALCSYGKDDPNPQDDFGGHIFENYRPPLPVGSRVVRCCQM